jgi:Na+-driven multidrug efflux pump
MLAFSGWDLYGNMAFTTRQQGANFLLNMFYGVALNAASGIASTVQGIFLQLSANVVTAFKPAIIKAYASGRYVEMNRLLCVATKMAMLLLMLITIVVFVRMDFILQLWLGQVPEGAVVLSRMLLLMNFFSLLGSIIMIGIHATGKVFRTGAINGTLYILTIPVMYVMLILGLGYTSCYIMFIISTMLFCITNLLILKRQVPQFELKNFVNTAVLPTVIATIIAFAVIFWASKFLCEGLNGFLILFVLSALVISLISAVIMLNAQERTTIYNLIKSKISR